MGLPLALLGVDEVGLKNPQAHFVRDLPLGSRCVDFDILAPVFRCEILFNLREGHGMHRRFAVLVEMNDDERLMSVRMRDWFVVEHADTHFPSGREISICLKWPFAKRVSL